MVGRGGAPGLFWNMWNAGAEAGDGSVRRVHQRGMVCEGCGVEFVKKSTARFCGACSHERGEENRWVAQRRRVIAAKKVELSAEDFGRWVARYKLKCPQRYLGRVFDV
tara:strand:+ start:490 stop:813 length:324 start_codon:yes stop_codon:yes gene_type:complete